MSRSMYSVASLIHYIKQNLDQDLNLQSILIKGEISNFTNHRSGHWYFTLKDNKAKISCVMFASYASRSKILLKEGMQVIVSASVSMYEAGGSMQLYVTKVQVDGLGDLFLQLEQVKQKLSLEGLFDPSHKKELPQYPASIGIITAKTGAAVQDMLTTLARRWPLMNVEVYPSLVQGTQAVDIIMEKLLHADKQGHDVILLARGGGSIEDLWCFNEERLARVVYGMKTVVVTGVGHETDTTLVDFVSDARAATPTAAAELITPDIQDVLRKVETARQRITSDIEHQIQQNRARLQPLKEHRYMSDPLAYIAQEQMKLAMHVKELGIVDQHKQRFTAKLQKYSHHLAILSENMYQRSASKVTEEKQKLMYQMEHYRTGLQQQMKEQVALLDAYSPLKIVSRGYHISYHNDQIIKSIHDVDIDDEVKLRMQDGIVTTVVKKKEAL